VRRSLSCAGQRLIKRVSPADDHDGLSKMQLMSLA
jgi:hypothetical protein